MRSLAAAAFPVLRGVFWQSANSAKHGLFRGTLSRVHAFERPFRQAATTSAPHCRGFAAPCSALERECLKCSSSSRRLLPELLEVFERLFALEVDSALSVEDRRRLGATWREGVRVLNGLLKGHQRSGEALCPDTLARVFRLLSKQRVLEPLPFALTNRARRAAASFADGLSHQLGFEAEGTERRASGPLCSALSCGGDAKCLRPSRWVLLCRSLQRLGRLDTRQARELFARISSSGQSRERAERTAAALAEALDLSGCVALLVFLSKAGLREEALLRAVSLQLQRRGLEGRVEVPDALSAKQIVAATLALSHLGECSAVLDSLFSEALSLCNSTTQRSAETASERGRASSLAGVSELAQLCFAACLSCVGEEPLLDSQRALRSALVEAALRKLLLLLEEERASLVSAATRNQLQVVLLFLSLPPPAERASEKPSLLLPHQRAQTLQVPPALAEQALRFCASEEDASSSCKDSCGEASSSARRRGSPSAAQRRVVRWLAAEAAQAGDFWLFEEEAVEGPYSLDLVVCRSARVCVEVEGETHFLKRGDAQLAFRPVWRLKRRILLSLGWSVFHVFPNDLRQRRVSELAQRLRSELVEKRNEDGRWVISDGKTGFERERRS